MFLSKYYKDYSKVDNLYYIFRSPIKEEFIDGCQVWEIECKRCHKIYKEVPSMIVSEKRQRGNNPCECWKRTKQSKGSYKIMSILDKQNISYEIEKAFDTCKSPSNHLMYFDFYLVNENILIEYDGEQHYRGTNFTGVMSKDELNEKLTKQKEYDIIKNRWALEHNIRLYRIPYYDYSNINEYEDIINEKYEVKNNE